MLDEMAIWLYHIDMYVLFYVAQTAFQSTGTDAKDRAKGVGLAQYVCAGI